MTSQDVFSDLEVDGDEDYEITALEELPPIDYGDLDALYEE